MSTTPTLSPDLIDMSHAFGHNLATNVRVRASDRLVAEANFMAPAPKVYERWIEIIQDVLVAARARGDLRKELDNTRVALWLVAPSWASRPSPKCSPAAGHP